MGQIENRTYDEIQIGDQASIKHKLSEKDVKLFAAISGDIIPAYLDAEFARSSMFREIVGHGMWGGLLISAVLGTQLPGPGSSYVSQDLKFLKPVKLGDELKVKVTVRDKGEQYRVSLECECANHDGETVIAGTAVVMAPTRKIKRPLGEIPRTFLVEEGERLIQLIDKAKPSAPIRTGVVHPVNQITLQGVAGALEQELIKPVLIGPLAKIEAAAVEADFDLSNVELVDAPHSHAAAAQAVSFVREGKLDALMKGALHTDEVMSEVVSADHGIRTERRISHVYVMDTPAYDKLLFITDAAVNVCPDLDAKRDIIQNAIDLAKALGVDQPKTAILSAVETVYPKLQSTIDAAALCKMSDRGQITGGLVDGPLAFDNAISPAAADAKGLKSPVAGRADVLVVPDLESGNMLAKELDYLAGAVAAGIVLGARVPIILTSRAEGELSRVAASAIAKLFHYHKAGV
ncbi:MAG: bifunctional enoyl-CoA hydratase/phosphate acetyltransferase [Marinicaulis sp.]|nr:bifunctional enoyl-CoA hydratase/phosphate acetyltransferase [Marinicaulis sp.]